MEIEYTARYLKLYQKLKNKRSIKDTDKVVRALTLFENLSEIQKSNLDVKLRDIDKTYRIRYSNNPEMRIIFFVKDLVQNDEKQKKKILELLWVGSREDYKRFAYNKIREEEESGMKIMISERHLKRINMKILDILLESEKDTSNSSNFSTVKFVKLVYQLGINHPEIAIAQSILETGTFTSNIFKKNNNLFGMKHPSKRKTTSLGIKNGHASYKNWQDSVVDYKLWQDARNLNSEFNKKRYLQKLNNIYCPPPECGVNNYGDSVLRYVPKANSYISEYKNKKTINENRFMGKNEGDLISVRYFSRYKLPRSIVENVLRHISRKIESNVSEKKLRLGEYDDVQIPLFGQLLSFLSGSY